MQEHKIFHKEQFWSSLDEAPRHGDHLARHAACISRIGARVRAMLAFSLGHAEGGDYLHVMLNAYWEPLAFELPPLKGKERWSRIVDTALRFAQRLLRQGQASGDQRRRVHGRGSRGGHSAGARGQGEVRIAPHCPSPPNPSPTQAGRGGEKQGHIASACPPRDTRANSWSTEFHIVCTECLI